MPIERRFTNVWRDPLSHAEIPMGWGCEKKIEELLGQRQVYQKPYRLLTLPVCFCGREHMVQ